MEDKLGIITELVDSVCRDGTDMPYVQYKQKPGNLYIYAGCRDGLCIFGSLHLVECFLARPSLHPLTMFLLSLL